jgi:uncharacterized LabA/DUF88 family protein
MDTHGVRLLEAIGEQGLRAALRHSFNRSGLVDLANACRLKFPGRRAQVVPEDRLLEELVKEFLKDQAVRTIVMKALLRENADLLSRLGAATPAEMDAMLAGLPAEQAGRALFVLGEDERETARARIEPLLRLVAPHTKVSQPAPAPAAGGPADEPAEPRRRLEEEIAILSGRIKKLEAAGAEREAAIEAMKRREAALEQEVVAGHKEAHHLRKELGHMEAERNHLKEEGVQLTGRLSQQEAAGPTARLEEISTRLSQLIRDVRKTSHDVEGILHARASGPDTARPYLDALAASVEALRREVAEQKRESQEEAHRLGKAVQDLSAQAQTLRSELAQWRKSASEPSPRRRGEQDRVAIFVDVQNMYYAARQLNARLDFSALMAAATRDRRLIRAIAYVVQNRDIDQSGFLAMLQQKNYEVRRKDLKIRHDGSSKGDWDMEMALDILKMAGSVEVVVLVSGDGDFASLVTQIKTLGPRVEVYSFPGSTAKELIEAADRHVPIDEGFLIRMSPSA